MASIGLLVSVRDSGVEPQFREELENRLEVADREKQSAIALTEARLKAAHQTETSTRDAEIRELQTRLEAAAAARSLAVREALAAVERKAQAAEGSRNALSA